MPRLPAMAVPPITVPIIRNGKFSREDVSERAERLREQATDQHALGAEAVAEQAERDPSAHPCQPLDTIDRDRSQHRDSAGDRIAHGMDDRTRMRGAAQE